MADLSEFIIKNLISNPSIPTLEFEQLRKVTSELTTIWFEDNPQVLVSIEKNFNMFTGLEFTDHKEDIMASISDHYADKIALVSYSQEDIKKLFKGVIYSEKKITEIKSLLRKGSNVLLAGSHFGGIEWSAAILTLIGLPCTIIANFKTEEVRKKAYLQAEKFNVDILDLRSVKNDYFKSLILKPRCIITVVDAFDRWVRSNKRLKANILGEEVTLDRRIDDFITKKLKSEVFWLNLKPTHERNFEVILKKVKPCNNNYIEPLMKEWVAMVMENPGFLYIWDELSHLFNRN